MHKRTLLILAILFCCNMILSLLPSCKRAGNTTYNDVCSSPVCFSYRSAEIHPFNSATKASIASNSNSVMGTELGMSVILEGTASVCYKSTPRKWYDGLSFISAAYAYAPPPKCNVRLGGDSIVAYNIYSNKDYDQQHPAGASLNDIITTDDVPSLPQEANYGNNSYIKLEFFGNKNPDNGYYEHTFTITLTQKDGDIITVKNEVPIRVLN